MIKVENLKKTYPGKIPVEALRGVSFQVLSGEFVAVMGRSGSGKSTLLHQLGLIDTPTEGNIVINGPRCLSCPTPKRRRLGWGASAMFFRNTLSLPSSTLSKTYICPGWRWD